MKGLMAFRVQRLYGGRLAPALAARLGHKLLVVQRVRVEQDEQRVPEQEGVVAVESLLGRSNALVERLCTVYLRILVLMSGLSS